MKHILAVRLSAMGDVAMTAVVIRAFIEQNPTVKITVLSRGFLKPLFDGIPNVSFFVVDTSKKHKGIFGLYQLYKELKKLELDALADLHNVLRSKVLRFFFTLNFSKTIKIKALDKGREEKKALTREKNKVFKQLKTTHERYADVFRELGYELDLFKVVFPKPKKLDKKLIELVQDQNSKLIGIAPFAQYDSKTYPLDLMEQVIALLSEKEGVKILLFGGGKEQVEKLTSFEEKFSNTICIAGKIKLDKELALISNLDCMLSMDSGNAHFGALYGIPTVTLWGATHPYAGFAPFQQSKENCILPDLEKYPKIPSSIYGNKIVEGYEDAMRSIKPGVVVERVLQLAIDNE